MCCWYGDHWRPTTPAVRCRTWLALVVSISTSLVSVAAEAQTGQAAPRRSQIECRVELAWSSDVPRRWAGQIRCVDDRAAAVRATLDEPVNLTPGPLLVGGLDVNDQGRIEFGPPTRLSLLPAAEGHMVSVKSTSGAIAFRVRGGVDCKLVIEMATAGGAEPAVVEVSLQDLLEGGQSVTEPLAGMGQLELRRIGGQELSVRLDGNTIFRPGQAVPLALAWRDRLGDSQRLALVGESSRGYLEVQTYRAADGSLVASEQWPVEIGPQRLRLDSANWTAPQTPGAYRVRCELRGGTPSKDPWGAAVTGMMPTRIGDPLSRVIQGAAPPQWAFGLVPFGPPRGRDAGQAGRLGSSEFSIAVVPAAVAPKTSLLDQVRWQSLGPAAPLGDPGTPSWLAPLTHGDWITVAAGGLAGKRPAAKLRQSLEPGQMVRYGISGAHPGRRHRAVLRLPVGVPVQLAVIAEDLRVRSADTKRLGQGLRVRRSGYEHQAQRWQEVIYDFWPSGPEVGLVVSNESLVRPLHLGEIEVRYVAPKEREEPPPEEAVQASQSKMAAAPATMPEGRLALLRLDLVELLQQFGGGAAPTRESPLDYHAIWGVTDRLIETLKREGYDGVVLTVASDGAALYPTSSWRCDAAWDGNWNAAAGPVDPLALLLARFDAHSLRLVPCLRPGAPDPTLERLVKDDPAGAVSIVVPSPTEGRLGAWTFDGLPMTSFGLYNPIAPPVAAALSEMVAELRGRCGDHPCVAGIGLLADERSSLRLPPEALIDSLTLDRFHAALAPQAPSRAALEGWLRNQGDNPLRPWRRAQMTMLVERLVERAGPHRLLLLATDSALPSSLAGQGADGKVLTARLLRRSCAETLANRVRDEACGTSVRVGDTNGDRLMAHQIGLFHQPATRIVPPAEGSEGSRAGVASIPGGLAAWQDETDAALSVSQLLGRSDRTMLIVGGAGANQPGGAIRRNSLRRFAQLPAIGMQDGPPGEAMASAVRLRLGVKEGDTYVYLANQVRWPVDVELEYRGPASVVALGEPAGRVDGRSASEADRANDAKVARQLVGAGQPDHQRLRISLAAGELAVFRFEGQQVEIRRWKAEFGGSPEQLAMIRQYVQGALSWSPPGAQVSQFRRFDNGGFESTETQRIPGWLTAQHPKDAVAVDRSVAFQGKCSMRLTSRSNRGSGSWIVSDVLTPPASGRLAVSVRLRGEAIDDAASLPPLKVRLALEGTVAGTPIRQTATVTVPRDGQWSDPPHRLEIARLPRLAVDSLRFTIDVTSDGVVWVDDVAWCDHFMTASERTRWDHLVFLAAGGISRGDLVAASRLIDSHWAIDLERADPLLPSVRPPEEQAPVATAKVTAAPRGREARSNAVAEADRMTESGITGPQTMDSAPGAVSGEATDPTAKPGWTERVRSILTGRF